MATLGEDGGGGEWPVLGVAVTAKYLQRHPPNWATATSLLGVPYWVDALARIGIGIGMVGGHCSTRLFILNKTSLLSTLESPTLYPLFSTRYSLLSTLYSLSLYCLLSILDLPFSLLSLLRSLHYLLPAFDSL